MIIVDWIESFFQSIYNSVPSEYQILVSLFLYTVFIIIYAVFIWKFYKFLASREIIKLNLRQYNNSTHPALEKVFAVVLYTVEYMIILPFLVLFWFTIFSLFLLLLSESQDAQQILMISAAIIVSTRVTAYMSEDLSKDIAKILPFTVLAMFVLNPSFFNIANLFDKLNQIPDIFTHILMFIIFIFVIEFVLRGLFSIVELFRSSDGETVETGQEETG
jgi:hypothetical protein